ncbi:MAG: hypothetical protein V1747_11175 [Candidatus Omnitrophota bacterium]
MRKILKIVVITIFIGIITKQVIGLADDSPIDYTKYIDSIEQLDFSLASAEYSEAKLIFMSEADERNSQFDPNTKSFEPVESETMAKKTLSRLILEYEKVEHNPKLRQKAIEKTADLYYRIGDIEKSSLKAKQVLTEYPKSLPASTVLAMCVQKKAFNALESQDIDKAISEYQSILEYPVASGIDAFANYFLGKMYERKLDNEKALIYYTNIVDECSELGWGKLAQRRIDKINAKK